MSRGLKIYTTITVAIIFALVVTLLYEPSDVRQLNEKLEQDEVLSAYPYHFRVLRVDDGVAVMSSPRSASVPVPVIISAIEPELKGISVSDERFFAAQQRLAEHQSRAQKLVMSDPDIRRVRWELDTRWLQERGVAF